MGRTHHNSISKGGVRPASGSWIHSTAKVDEHVKNLPDCGVQQLKIFAKWARKGYPLQPWKEGLRTLQNLTHLTEMRKELAYLKDKAQK